MKAENIMHANLVTAEPEMRLYQALEIMEEKQIRHLPVVEQGRLVGILSDRDIKKHMSASFQTKEEGTQDRLAMLKTAREVMASDPITARPETPLKEVVQVMVDRKIGALPVVDIEGRPVGIITSIDLHRLLLERL